MTYHPPIDGLKAAYSLVPIVGTLLAVWVMWGYDVTEDRANAIRAELESRRGTSPVIT